MTRLIDAEKLKSYIDTCQFCEKCPNIAFMCQRSCELPDCLTNQWERVIDEQSTVDAAPVRYGRWIKGSETKMIKKNKYLILADAMYCSECENEAYWDTDYGQQLFDYCPYCGARMDEE